MSLLFGDLFSLGPGVDLFDVGAGNLYELSVPCPDSSGLLFGDLFCASGTDLFQIDPSTNVFDLDAPVVPCNSEDYLFGDLFCLGDGSDLFDIGSDNNVFLLGEDEGRPHHGGNGGKRRRWRYEDDELLQLRLRADDEALLAIVFAFVEVEDGFAC